MFCFQHFSGHCIHVILIFDAICCKLQLEKGSSVIVVKFPVIENSIGCADICLSKSDFLGLLQSNIGRRSIRAGISRIIVLIIDGDDLRSKAQVLNRVPGACAHIFKEVVAGKYGTGLNLEHDIFLVSIDIFHKVTGCVDFCNQIF